MFTAMVIFHTLVCILLIIVVLMQSSKGEGLAGAFGGGGSGLTGAVFGGRGAASFLSKSTTVLAIVFMINCGALAYMSSNRTGAQATAAESAVTREAAKELERQAQQQQIPVDQVQPGETQQQPSGEPTGTPATPPEGGGK
ncbi:MAG: preprotein translocase subunit SecG [Candidatus Zixiibacteriota bacterium]